MAITPIKANGENGGNELKDKMVVPSKMEMFLEYIKEIDAADPDSEKIRIFKESLNEIPDIWRLIGDLSSKTANKMIDDLDGSRSFKLSLGQGLKNLYKDLGFKEATSLEKILIEQVALSWLRLVIVEYRYTVITSTSTSQERLNYWERRLNASQRRFFRACETLARIRKMNLPPIQVNIGQNQMNQLRTRS